MAMSDKEVEYQALDFIHFNWTRTGDPKWKREFDDGIKKLNVTEAQFFTRIATFDAARKLSKQQEN